MKLTESTDACTSDREAFTIKVNIKETFMENEGFLQMFMWWMGVSQKIKNLLLGKFSIYWGKNRFMLLCPHSWKPLDLW